MKKTRIRLSLFSLVLALVLFGLTIRLTGRDPLVVYWSILTGSFGSTKSFLNVLAYMLPLIMTGLGAAVAFQSGVFNIGGEGQVLVGGLASVIVGLTVPLPAPWGWLLALLFHGFEQLHKPLLFLVCQPGYVPLGFLMRHAAHLPSPAALAAAESMR